MTINALIIKLQCTNLKLFLFNCFVPFHSSVNGVPLFARKYSMVWKVVIITLV